MGTRNLTMVIHNGKHVVAQYGQWDGCPDGQGKTARAFMADKFNREKFLDALSRTRWVTDEEVDAGYKKSGSNGSGFDKLFPCLSRDHGAKILEMVQDSNSEVLLKDSSNFANDSLLCEWAYVIDLDKNTFEVYCGFNKSPVPEGERFAGGVANKNGYYAVRLLKSYPLDNLPSETEFLKIDAPVETEA